MQNAAEWVKKGDVSFKSRRSFGRKLKLSGEHN